MDFKRTLLTAIQFPVYYEKKKKLMGNPMHCTPTKTTTSTRVSVDDCSQSTVLYVNLWKGKPAMGQQWQRLRGVMGYVEAQCRFYRPTMKTTILELDMYSWLSKTQNEVGLYPSSGCPLSWNWIAKWIFCSVFNPPPRQLIYFICRFVTLRLNNVKTWTCSRWLLWWTSMIIWLCWGWQMAFWLGYWWTYSSWVVTLHVLEITGPALEITDTCSW